MIIDFLIELHVLLYGYNHFHYQIKYFPLLNYNCISSKLPISLPRKNLSFSEAKNDLHQLIQRNLIKTKKMNTILSELNGFTHRLNTLKRSRRYFFSFR